MDALALGITEEHYNLLMGITANALGFTLVFTVSILLVLQGKK